jgi:hypothetical protein
MKIAGRKRSKAILIAGSMALTQAVFVTAVFADEPNPGAMSSTNTTSETTSPAGGNGQVRPEASTATPAEAGAAKPEANTTTTLQTGLQEVAPGPLFEQRKSLFSKITDAKRAGIGVASYLSAFAFVESMVRSGKPASAIQDRVESLTQAMDDQLKRAQVLKTQRPTPPSPSQSISTSAKAGGGGGAPSGNTAALINQLKEKYADKIPANLKDMSPDQFLNSDQGKAAMKLLNK